MTCAVGWWLGRIGRLVEDGQWGCVVTSLVLLGPQLREESAGQTRRNQRINFGREAEKMGALRSLWLNLAYCSMNMFMHKMGVVKSIVEVPSNLSSRYPRNELTAVERGYTKPRLAESAFVFLFL